LALYPTELHPGLAMMICHQCQLFNAPRRAADNGGDAMVWMWMWMIWGEGWNEVRELVPFNNAHVAPLG